MSLRDAIRKATLGSQSEFKKEVVKWNGVEVELRQPSVKQRQELFKRCVGDGGKIDSLEFMTLGVIACTYVPGTDEKVFDDTDYDGIMARPAGGFLDKFGAQIAELTNVDEDMGNA